MASGSLGVQVAWDHGLTLRGPQGELHLDPGRPNPGPAVVSHAHLDHLRGNAHMTPPTRDFLAARMGLVDAKPLPLRTPTRLGGWDVELHDAGHCLGAAMVEVGEGDLLYTGDFNPVAGFTTPGAQALGCDTLVIESTYGDPRLTVPPRELVLASMEAWLDRTLPEGGAVMGSYQLGRAQELVALLNRRGVAPAVTPDIAALNAIYRDHGVPLRWTDATPDELYGTLEPGMAMIVPRAKLARGEPFSAHLRESGAKAAYVSGWCAAYSYFNKYELDAQFALTDHATFDHLLGFVEACKPRRVLTVMGKTAVLAREVQRRLGIRAEPMG